MPPTVTPGDHDAVSPLLLVDALGAGSAALINLVAAHAHSQQLPLFLVGGVVRDLLLGRPNLDLDFVLESDAMRFARDLAAKHGGELEMHAEFGTAKWLIDADALNLEADTPAARIDFARARREEYRQPAALPTVSPASIADDLGRRDFSINALALQLSPAASMWRILDRHGGRDDLAQGLIRVLHERSFIDDPTRMLRALRLAGRLGFALEPRTCRLLDAALPMIKRLSGERIRNEIDLILREDQPGAILLGLEARGLLRPIHASWRLPPALPQLFQRARRRSPPWQDPAANLPLGWQLLTLDLRPDDAAALSQRLSLKSRLRDSIVACAAALAQSALIHDAATRPSQITQLLDDLPNAALHALWIRFLEHDLARKRIERFALEWRHQRPLADGNDLKRRGLPPGPAYRDILQRLRFAWIDGEIQSQAEEIQLLERLLSGAEAPKHDEA